MDSWSEELGGGHVLRADAKGWEAGITKLGNGQVREVEWEKACVHHPEERIWGKEKET